MSKQTHTCGVCEDQEATLHLILSRPDGEVIDDEWLCEECARDRLVLTDVLTIP